MIDHPPETVRGAKGEYLLRDVLGEGGFGIVYSASDVSSGSSVAVKLLRPETLTRQSRERFRQEIAALERLAHPHIAPIVDEGTHRDVPFMVLRRLSGDSLATILGQRGPLEADDVVEMLRSIGSALDHAHGRGVLHRDITPSNIIKSEGQWWLIDFGLALDVDDVSDERLTSSGIVVGTSTYMSPEQVAGNRQIDGRSDQYSLACVAYHALAGVPPFQGGSPQATRAMRLYAAPPDLQIQRPGISLALTQALMRALAREPVDRFPNLGALCKAIDASPSGRVPYTRARRNRTLWLMSGAITVAALLFTAWRGTRAAVPTADPRRGGLGTPAALATPNPLRVAILFFDDLTPDKSLGWLSRGLTSDVIHDLSALDTLTVVSVSGVQPYRDRALPVDSVAMQLEAGTIVDGTVRRVANQRLEVTVRFVDASAGFKVHSVRLLKPEAAIAELQEQLLFEISSYLREHLGRAATALRRQQIAPSAEAWRMLQVSDELLAKGWDFGRRGEATRAWELFARADSFASAASSIAPRWEEPVIMRARIARAQLRSISVTQLVPGQRAGAGGDIAIALERISVGLAYAKQALESVPNNGEAATLQAYFRFMHWFVLGKKAISPEFVTAKAELEALTQRDGSQALAWVLLSRIYEFSGETERSDSAAQRALAADPFLAEGRRAIADLILKHLEAGRVTSARPLCDAVNPRYQDDIELAECHLVILGWTATSGDSVRAAWREIARIEAIGAPALSTGWLMRRMYVAAVAARSGLPDSARKIIARGRMQQGPDHADSSAAAVAEAWVAVLSGDDVRALGVLDSLLATDGDQRARVLTHPWFARLRSNPRFQALRNVP